MHTMSDFFVFERKSLPQNPGFTLIEMTMVLVILGLLLGGLMAPLSTQMDNNHRRDTRAQLDKIHEALLGYVLVHGYLPCPDVNHDGQEDRTPDGCTTHTRHDPKGDAKQETPKQERPKKEDRVWHGIVPWIDLGVGAQDAWGNRFTYAVSARFTDASNTPLPTFSLETQGTLHVKHGADNVPAVVLSHGANTQGGISTQGTAHVAPTSATELENSDRDAHFNDAPYHNDASQGFDDQMVWISPYILKNRVLMAGRLVR